MQLLAGGGASRRIAASRSSARGGSGGSGSSGAAVAGSSCIRGCYRAGGGSSATIAGSNRIRVRAGSNNNGAGGAGAGAPSPPPQLLDNATGPRLLADVDTFLFDQDGVLWRGNETIPGALKAVNELRVHYKRRVLFVTNNSSKSRAEYAQKLSSLGVENVTPADIVASSFTAAAYLRDELHFGRTDASRNKRVLVLGSPGLVDEVSAVLPGGRDAVVDGRTLDKLPVFDTPDKMLALKPDASIGAVVAGWDPSFTFSKLFYISACVREQGAALLATNLDHADAIGGGRMMPGTGCLARALSVACGVEAIDCGKGGAWLLPWLVRQYELDPSRTAVVGDRLDTDVALGKQGGFKTVLPTTGVTTLADARAAAAAGEGPDFVAPSVAALVGRCTLTPLAAN